MGRASARGPGRPAAHGPGRAKIIYFAGRAVCGPETCRPGLVSNTFAGCGPGLGLTFPGPGRVGPTVKVTLVLTSWSKITYPHLSIAIRSLFSICCKCNCTQWLQDMPASQSTIHSMLNNDPQMLNFRRAHSK